jgi:diguanylate cyclase (GGDEF)-like protein/PAS domain S-box-containing protein
VGVAGGVGMTFAIAREQQLAGYARVILEENRLISSADRVSLLLGTMWNSALDMLYTLSLAAVLGAALIAATFSWLFSRRLSAPLTEMSLAARKFASGHLDYVIPLVSNDEIGELAGSLNTMAHQLRKSGHLLSKAQEMSGVGGWEFDVKRERFDWSPQISRVFGLKQDRLPSTFLMLVELVHPDDCATLKDVFAADFSQNSNFSIEFRLAQRDGELRTLRMVGEVTLSEDKLPKSMIGTCQDVSDLKRAEEGLRFLASYDPLTGLPNRSLFHDRLHQALAHADRNRGQVGLLFLDLDHFKMINDRLGHSYGDALLKQVAERLNQAVREVDTVARMGGDEFTIILEGLHSSDVAAMVANKVLQSLWPAIRIGAHELNITASIGVTMYPADATQVETLLSNADTAMYRAKEEGKNTFRFFTREMEERIQARLLLETNLRNALLNHEFVLFSKSLVATWLASRPCCAGAGRTERWFHRATLSLCWKKRE